MSKINKKIRKIFNKLQAEVSGSLVMQCHLWIFFDITWNIISNISSIWSNLTWTTWFRVPFNEIRVISIKVLCSELKYVIHQTSSGYENHGAKLFRPLDCLSRNKPLFQPAIWILRFISATGIRSLLSSFTYSPPSPVSSQTATQTQPARMARAVSSLGSSRQVK